VRVPPFFELVVNAALHVLGELGHHVLALAEGHLEHHDAFRGVVEKIGDEGKVFEDAFANAHSDSCCVHLIAGKAVRVPAEDAVDLASVNKRKHLVELGPPLFFGGPALFQGQDDGTPGAGGKFLGLLDLALDGLRLPFVLFGRLSDVEEIPLRLIALLPAGGHTLSAGGHILLERFQLGGFVRGGLGGDWTSHGGA